MSEHQSGPKPITIYINTRPVEVAKKEELSFEELAQLAFPEAPAGVGTSFSISYRKGQGLKAEGTLVAGQSIRVKDGEIFNVIRTDKS